MNRVCILVALLLATCCAGAQPVRADQAAIEASAQRMVEARARRVEAAKQPSPTTKTRAIEAPPMSRPAKDTIASALETGGSSPWAIVLGLTLLTLLPALLL